VAGRLLQVLNQLRRELPTDYPVRMRRRRDLCSDSNGTCTLLGAGKKRRYSIVIRSTISLELAVAMLIHEYAEALAWGEDVHSARWAREYGRAYRAVHGD